MLRVTVELFPYGQRENKVTLRQYDIVNEGPGEDSGYDYTMYTGDGAWDVASVENWDRDRSVEELVAALFHVYTLRHPDVETLF